MFAGTIEKPTIGNPCQVSLSGAGAGMLGPVVPPALKALHISHASPPHHLAPGPSLRKSEGFHLGPQLCMLQVSRAMREVPLPWSKTLPLEDEHDNNGKSLRSPPAKWSWHNQRDLIPSWCKMSDLPWMKEALSILSRSFGKNIPSCLKRKNEMRPLASPGAR